jgi:YwiC-like protein
MKSSNSHSVFVDAPTQDKTHPSLPNWCRPIFSPEHGVYVVLLVSFLTGVAAAHHWTWATTLALICAFCGFQAEHPFVMQIRQRKSFKLRFWVWGSLYGGIASAIALYLYWRTGEGFPPLLWIYLGAIAALIFDSISVLNRDQKSILNEVITFTATCLAAPFAYGVTTGSISPIAIGLWLLNTLFFSCSIFTMKLRKPEKDQQPSTPLQRLLIYHFLATAMVVGLASLGILPILTALAFSILLCKVGFILWQRQWYCTTKIQTVAMIETISALLFWMTISISILPAHLA